MRRKSNTWIYIVGAIAGAYAFKDKLGLTETFANIEAKIKSLLNKKTA